jgi:predicted ATP-grasp superfamily ATP-dependent carboligase
MTPATVIIGDHTQGLGILRSAAAAGSDVWVVNDKHVSLARASNRLSGYSRLPHGLLRLLHLPEVEDALLAVLLELPVPSPALLCGVDEDIVRFIHRRAARLRTRYFVPDVQFDRIYDKYAFNALLPEPAQIDTRLCSEAGIDGLSRPERFILKGRQGFAFRQLTGEKAIRVDRLTPQVRERLFSRLNPDQILVQEIVETDRPVTSLCSFAIDGRIAGVFAYEKLRQHPADFGTGTYLRSVPPDALRSVASAIVAETRFTGISEIEFVFDRRDGQSKVIEMNPRTWKSIHFATQCGQNLVARYLRYVAGAPVDAASGYASAEYWTDLATDLPQLVRRPMMPQYLRGFYECTWDRTDPWPAVVLWTLFPLIALENGLANLAAAARGGRAAAAGPAAAARTTTR